MASDRDEQQIFFCLLAGLVLSGYIRLNTFEVLF
jgi:hypothetical protein